MKKLLIICCLVAGTQRFASAQILTLDVVTFKGSKTVIAPTYSNIFKIMRADTAQFSANMRHYGYAYIEHISKTTRASNFETHLQVLKTAHGCSIGFDASYGNTTEVVSSIKKQHPEFVYETGEDGRETYRFTDKDGTGISRNFMLYFNNTPNDHGKGIMLYWTE